MTSTKYYLQVLIENTHHLKVEYEQKVLYICEHLEHAGYSTNFRH